MATREETRKERPLDLTVLHNLVTSFFFLRSTLRTFYYLDAAPCIFADPSGLVPIVGRGDRLRCSEVDHRR
jgi:hypothetical protein